MAHETIIQRVSDFIMLHRPIRPFSGLIYHFAMLWSTQIIAPYYNLSFDTQSNLLCLSMYSECGSIYSVVLFLWLDMDFIGKYG